MSIINANKFFLLNLICFLFSFKNVSSTKDSDAQNNSTFNSTERFSEKYVSKDDKLSAFIYNQVTFDMFQIV